jgi:hypothetical protein
MVTKVVDSKGRVSLGRSLAGKTVIVDDSDPNRIIVLPAVAVPIQEAWLYKNRVALDRVRRGLKDAKERKFSRIAPDLKADVASADGTED